jgi:peptide/nickel transport system substrate-binding protein
VQDKTGFLGFMRVNHLTPPFNNPAIRRLLFAAVDQQDFVTAAVGTDPSLSHTPIGFFSPGSPMASDAGLEALTSRRDPERVKRELKAAGYAGEQVVVLVPTDFPGLKALADVGADVLARNGFNTVPVYLDWGSMVQRLSRVEAPEQGGWNVYHSYWSGLDQWDPAVNSSLRATGRTAGRPGWPDSPRLEALREQWLQAPDLAAQQRLARDIQLQAFEDVPYVPLGQTFAPTAYRSDISGLPTGYALFWNVKRG